MSSAGRETMTSSTSSTSEWALDLSKVTKRFGATVALDNASFHVRRGAVHALLGENGAGKSTTVKLLSGLMQPDAGSISIMGRKVRMRGPKDAHRAGVQTAFQEMTLVRDLTVAQNLLMAYEPTGWFGRIKRRESQRQAAEWLDRLELGDIRPGAYIRDLALPVRQKIEIAKALVRQPEVLLLDEPTSALSGRDVAWLARRIEEMKARGVTFVFITHRMQEVREFCDSLTVYRNGRDVGAFDTAAISDDEVIRLVIGRSMDAKYPPKVATPAALQTPAMEARGIKVDAVVNDFDLTLKAGEVHGIAALQGMGQREIFEALFGAEFIDEGQILIDGKPVTLTSTADSLKAGGRRKRLAAGHQALLAFRPDRQETRAGGHQARAGTDGSQPACSLQTVPVVFGRQPAEDSHGEMAADAKPRVADVRPDARYRRRHQAPDLRADARVRGGRRFRAVLFHRRAGTGQCMRPGFGGVSRAQCCGAGRRGAH